MTKAIHPETESEAPGFEAQADAVAFKTKAVDPKTEAEAARQYVNKSHMCAVSLTCKAYKRFLT